MADEANTENADASVTVAVTPPEKKTRQPRKAKTAAEAVAPAETVSSEEPVKKTRAKRGSKVTPAKPAKTPRKVAAEKTDVAEAPAITGSNSTAPATSVSSASEPIDEFADLLKLEEENRSLRKQLSEKLRAENADLRKRLGQN